jgi:2-dehydro-3-deoxygluconokinase
MVELVTFGETPIRFSPPDSERVEMAREARMYADGIESNVAVATAALGTEVLWLSKLPDTAIGRNVVHQIESSGAGTAITWTDDPESRQGIVFRESAVQPRESRYWHDRASTAAATAEPAEFPIETVQESQAVYTALSTAVLSDRVTTTAEALLRAGGSSGAVTAVDLDYTPGLASSEQFGDVFERLSDEVDILISSETGVRDVLGETGRVRELTNTLSAVYDLQIVVLRREEGSAAALHDTPGTNVIHERESVETDTVDPTGARGAFTGAFLHELIQGSDTSSALNVAVATAALAETTPGPFLNKSGDEIETIVDSVRENSGT